MSSPWWVLVVDDDAEVNALIVEMLCDEGFVARGSTQARAAMALLESASPPGFIIADLTMPEIGGVDLVGCAERQGIKGMLITASDPRRLPPGPSVPVIRKAFEVDELLRVVARYRPESGAGAAIAVPESEPAQVACGA